MHWCILQRWHAKIIGSLFSMIYLLGENNVYSFSFLFFFFALRLFTRCGEIGMGYIRRKKEEEEKKKEGLPKENEGG